MVDQFMKAIKELDVVTLAVDLDAKRLKKGMKGTIVAVFRSPSEAYEVEFVDPITGETLEVITLEPDQLVETSSEKN